MSECADLLNYWPEEEDRPEGAGPLRYVAIRMRKKQGELFADGSEARYFAVASNQWKWEAARLLKWHREKAGTIEALHDVLKNDLAAGVRTLWSECGMVAAGGDDPQRDAALKRIALPEPWLRARPKRLRFQIFISPGKLIRHARQMLLRVARVREQLAEWAEALRLMPAWA